MRAALLGSFSHGTALGVVAPASSGFSELVASRNDSATTFVPFDADSPGALALEGCDNLIVEGLDELAEPVAFLRSLRAAAASARLFLLVANAAHAGALSAFFRGERLCGAHPLVKAELEDLLAASGWKTLAVNPLPAPSTLPAGVFPVHIATAGIQFDVADAAMLERLAPQAFVAIAEAA